MARLPRLSLPGQLHHVVQRGNNRQLVFLDEDDFGAMQVLIAQHARACGVAVHAFVLMPNHFHLLLTPQSDDGVPRMLQAVGRSYVQAFNRRHGRSGTLWEGRYRSTVMQPAWMLPGMVYLDLNPVRAGLVGEASAYPWSSHGHWMGLRSDLGWLVSPPPYWALGNTPFAREQAYAALVSAGLGGQQVVEMTDAVLKGWALGDAAFLASLQAQTPRRLAPGRRGRPTRVLKTDKK